METKDKPVFTIDWIVKKVMISDAEIEQNKAIRKREKREQKLKRILGDV